MDAVTDTQVAPSAAPRAAPPVPFWRRNENVLLGGAAVLVFLAFWEAAVAFGLVNPLFTSAPSRFSRSSST